MSFFFDHKNAHYLAIVEKYVKVHSLSAMCMFRHTGVANSNRLNEAQNPPSASPPHILPQELLDNVQWPPYVSASSRDVICGLLAGSETERLGGTAANVEAVRYLASWRRHNVLLTLKMDCSCDYNLMKFRL